MYYFKLFLSILFISLHTNIVHTAITNATTKEGAIAIQHSPGAEYSIIKNGVCFSVSTTHTFVCKEEKTDQNTINFLGLFGLWFKIISTDCNLDMRSCCGIDHDKDSTLTVTTTSNTPSATGSVNMDGVSFKNTTVECSGKLALAQSHQDTLNTTTPTCEITTSSHIRNCNLTECLILYLKTKSLVDNIKFIGTPGKVYKSKDSFIFGTVENGTVEEVE